MLKPVPVIAAAGILALGLIGLAAWLAQHEPGSASATPAATQAGPPIGGSLRNFRPIDPPRPAPDAGFLDGERHVIGLAAFRGKVVLLNFWATWCGPCVEEMPSLDRVQAKLGSDDFVVVALSQDRGGLPVVERFYRKLGLSKLDRYFDPDNGFANRLGIQELPTTLILDRDGRAVGALGLRTVAA